MTEKNSVALGGAEVELEDSFEYVLRHKLLDSDIYYGDGPYREIWTCT